jgi:hypothetical protein
MYSAVSRSILRNRALTISRSIQSSRIIRTQYVIPTTTFTRAFHSSPITWKNTDPEVDEHSSGSPSPKTPKVSENELGETVQDAEITAKETTDQLAQESVQVNDGQTAYDEVLVQKLAEGVLIDEALVELGQDPAQLSDEDKQELSQLAEEFKLYTAKNERMDKLAEEISNTPEDIEGAIARSGVDEDDLTSLSKRERKMMRAEGMNVQDEEEMDQGAYRAWGDEGEDEEFGDYAMEEDLVKQYARDTAEGESKLNFDPMARGGQLDSREELMADLSKREQQGFWNEDREEDLGPDEVFNQDDLPGQGHIDLELHKEIREYARLMVWELPLLSSKSNTLNLS